MFDTNRWLLVLVVAAAGCTREDNPVVEILPDACASSLLPPDASAEPAMVCGTVSRGSLVLGQAVTGTTSTSTNTRMPTCAYGASGMSPDVAYHFVAPSAGVYYFDTAGSSFNAVLTILDQSCLELACASNPSSSTPRLVVALDAGQEIAIIVDGWNGSQGSYTLLADAQPSCNPQVLTGALPISTTVSVTGSSRWSSACGGSGPEATFQYTIPADGYYTFDTIGSTVDTQLYVRGDCYGGDYACDDQSGGNGAAMLSNYLPAGSTFEFVVDTNGSGGGTVRFNISGPPPPPPPPACPETSLGSMSPRSVSGSTDGAAATLASVCGGSGPEKTYSFTAPATGTFRFDTYGSQGDTVLHVYDASCSGPLLACNDDDSGLTSRVEVQLTQGQTIVIVVDSFGLSGAPYTLNITGPL